MVLFYISELVEKDAFLFSCQNHQTFLTGLSFKEVEE